MLEEGFETTARSCGKIILSGEHFVLEGGSAVTASCHRALVLGIGTQKKNLAHDIGLVPDFAQKAFQKVWNALSEFFQVPPEKQSVALLTVHSKIPLSAGLGSSAAFCVATVRAFLKCFQLSASEAQFFQAAWHAEHVFHGCSSGIDPWTVSFPGVWFFKKKSNFLKENKKSTFIKTFPFQTKRICLKQEVPMVVAVTRSKRKPTSEMIQVFQKKKEEKKASFLKDFHDTCALASSVEKSLTQGDLSTLGKALLENHALLKTYALSSSEVEAIQKHFQQAGALGSKMTGAGGGGAVIAVAPEQEASHFICQYLKKHWGGSVFVTEISS